MQELPPASRITSRADGAALRIIIPEVSPQLPGLIRGLSLVTAAFAFLAVTFTAQGLFIHENHWLFAGFLFFILTLWRLIAGGFLPRKQAPIVLEIGPEFIAILIGPEPCPRRRQWVRPFVTDVQVQPRTKSAPAALVLHFGGQPPLSLVTGIDPRELNWLAEQIRHKWGSTARSPDEPAPNN